MVCSLYCRDVQSAQVCVALSMPRSAHSAMRGREQRKRVPKCVKFCELRDMSDCCGGPASAVGGVHRSVSGSRVHLSARSVLHPCMASRVHTDINHV